MADDPSLEPTMAVLSMSFQWHRLLQNERARVRSLNYSLSTLQIQLQECESTSAAKDMKIRALEVEYENVTKALNRSLDDVSLHDCCAR